MDWSDGEYEHTARELAPMAARVIASLGPLAGKRVLDVGCGTGNAALEAARRGAEVVAIDPAPRLVEVARRRAEAEGLRLDARVGDAAHLPAEDGSVFAVTSVFAVIFAPDADAAVREILRVLRDDGCAVVTSWTTEGAIADVSVMIRAAMAPADAAPGDAPARPGPAWGDAAWVEALFARHGGAAVVEATSLRFEAPSAKAWLDRQVEHHPVWRMVRRAHEGRPAAWSALHDAMLARLARGNEAADGESGWFVTSKVNVITARRSGR
jgi:ubiquinone/menaquinone biosynthesis C-methylase UbiE